jgi:MFS family permease
MTPARPRLWTGSFTAVVLATASTFTGFYFLIPALPPYAATTGAGPASVGLVIGIYSIAAIAVRLTTASLLDRYGRKPFLLAGLALYVAASLSYPLVGTFPMLLVLRVLHGGAWAWVTTAFGSLVSDLAPAERRGEGIGYWGLAPTVAMAVGPFLGSILLARAGYTAVFAGTAAFGLLALGGSLLIREPQRGEEASAGPRFALPSVSLTPAATLFFSSLSYGALIAFLPIELVEAPGRAGMFFSIYAVSILVSRPFAGKLSDRFGRSAVIHPGLALGAVGTLLIGLAREPLFLVVSAVLYGVGIAGFSFPGLMALTVDRGRAESRSATIAGFFIAYDLAISLGAILLGPVYGRWGFGAMNAVAAGFVVFAQLVYTAAMRRRAA